MSTTREQPERAWERGWDEHQLAQLRRLARLPLPEKLAWLEEAHRVARHLRRQQLGNNQPAS